MKTDDSLQQALSIVGDKWSMQIILHIHENKTMRFGECQQANGINTKTLSQRLNSLNEDGIVTKTEYKEYPPRVEYELTDQGKQIVPIILQLSKWAKNIRKK